MLRDAGIVIAEISLKGRFHDPNYSELQELIDFCDSHSEKFSLPDASRLIIPTRYDGGNCLVNGKLHEIALRAILVDQCDWFSAFTSMHSRLSAVESSIVSFGLERCVPASFLQDVSHKLLHAKFDTGKQNSTTRSRGSRSVYHDQIAVLGMSCRVPGANDLEDFWTLLCENKSQHVEVSGDRFAFSTPWRDGDAQRKWYANLIHDCSGFDNKFFNKSPREAAAMDPQQKMMLQAAYQAVEQAGYLHSQGYLDKHVGCYIGVSNVDYQDNVACYPANAYTATGTLMSFVAGKVSHYFGWTGPSMSIDTACSGSAVAVHEACKAILNGDCTSALAGGVNAITSPLWFQNLAGASFLSTSGQCKPFDAKGDGYCRGEAVGALYLKKMSAALADGDLIYGTIAATAVQQNQNCTAITVPNSPSLSDLFRNVTGRAKINPQTITVVEAHGTGTAVGDPAEYGAIRATFGGQKRSNILALRSVKGLLGHSECASGIVALIKTLLMINKGYIAPQASHDTINPALNVSASDKIEISTQLKPWSTDYKAALINNYGASGSNASMVVTEAPSRQFDVTDGFDDSSYALNHPFWFSAADDKSLRSYIVKFINYIKSKAVSIEDRSLQNIAFNVARQSNRSLGQALIFSVDSLQNLESTLESFAYNGQDSLVIRKSRPVILCFGGQVSTYVGLNREIYERTTILRKHLDECDSVCKAMDISSIYPAIFHRSTIEDTVQLQIVLFAMEYACAKTWIDCGINVTAVVGHSFGELVAQCVVGVLTLIDALKLIARRAGLIKDSWESDRGSMIAVEADPEVLENLLARAKKTSPSDRPATIACVNGPRSFTVAGSTMSIERVEDLLAKNNEVSASIRSVRLKTSHAFHSTLVESIIPQLSEITYDVTFSEPLIHIERATINTSTQLPGSRYIAEHLRQPVYFSHAVQRLAQKHDDAVWIEVGSQSTVTKMASKALGNPKTSHFQAMDLTSDNSWARLVEATIALWKQGVRMNFWPHHISSTVLFTPLMLPPYQFDMSEHFLELKSPQHLSIVSHEPVSGDQPAALWTFIGYKDSSKQSARLRVETSHQTFQELMAGHTVANSQPLCPSTLQLDIATEAIRSLCPEFPISDFQIDLRNLENQSPICRDSSREVWLDVTAPDQSRRLWSWKMISNPQGSKNGENLHATGIVIFRQRDDPEFLGEMRRFERLVTHKRCKEILGSNGGSEDILQGTNTIYKLFADVVDYSEVFRGVRKVVGIANSGESAGRVIKQYSGETWLDTPLCDSFCQVAGVFVNCMTHRSDSDAFISNGVERIVRSPLITDLEEKPNTFDIFAQHHRPTDRSYSSDVFVFNSHTSQLLGVILGIQYQRVSKLSMAKLLSRLTPSANMPLTAKSDTNTSSSKEAITSSSNNSARQQASAPEAQSAQADVRAKTIAVLSDMVGVDPGSITDSTNLPDLGIDSLMGMEVARDLESAFKCSMDTSSMMSLVVFSDLVRWVSSAVGAGNDTDGGKTELLNLEKHSNMDESPESWTPSTTPRYTDGSDDESKASSQTDVSQAVSLKPLPELTNRQVAVDCFVTKYSDQFSFRSETSSCHVGVPENCVLITGATGSLGAHLVEHFLKLSSTNVVCFNRPSSTDPVTRQRNALEQKGITIDDQNFAKVQIIASDASKPLLGLNEAAYANLVKKTTHIIHNAWPMSITRSIAEFEKQFVIMRNLIDFACEASYKLPQGKRFGFQFVSSIATVGLRPVVTGEMIVPERPTEVQYALPSGYSDAKLVCERLLSETLNQHPERIITTAVRVGQVAGSRTNGYWNPSEHLSLLIKSAQTLSALPDLPGELSWLPVNDVAAVLAELVLSTSLPPSAICHVENPIRQPWSKVLSFLAAELGIPPSGIVPYDEWLLRVLNLPSARDTENPAKRVMHFLQNEFLRMACGGLVLSTENALKSSETLRRASAVQEDTIKSYVHTWRKIGFLS